jgi:hypothetical protein
MAHEDLLKIDCTTTVFLEILELIKFIKTKQRKKLILLT